MIHYSIAEGMRERTRLTVYDLHGKLVKLLVDGVEPPGNHSVYWDGRNEKGVEVSSGVYFYRIQAGDFCSTRKMILVR